jgi:hypothetical protein
LWREANKNRGDLFNKKNNSQREARQRIPRQSGFRPANSADTQPRSYRGTSIPSASGEVADRAVAEVVSLRGQSRGVLQSPKYPAPCMAPGVATLLPLRVLQSYRH